MDPPRWTPPQGENPTAGLAARHRREVVLDSVAPLGVVASESDDGAMVDPDETHHLQRVSVRRATEGRRVEALGALPLQGTAETEQGR